MKHASRARGQWVAAALTLVLIVTGIWPAAMAGAWQATPEPIVELAAPPILEQAWSFLGQTTATSDQISVTGWLTGVSGLQPAELVAPDAGPEQLSRFTFVADVAVGRTSSRGSAVTSFGAGTLAIYLNEATPASADDPLSFAAGTIVAAYSVELQETTLRQSPELGIVTGQMSLVQTDALNFTLDGERFRFGHANAELALRYSGGLTPTADGATGGSIFGTASVSRRDADPRSTGEAVAVAALSECEQLALWVGETTARLQTASDLRAGILSASDPATADLEGALATVTALVEEQRAAIGPEGSAEAARLALTALSTDARGLELLVAAAADGNEAAITQGLAILSDAAGLTNRAFTTIEEITPTCEPPA